MNCAVTGAFGYSGKYIAERLLAKGHSVVTLTNSTGEGSPLKEKIVAHPFNFDFPDKLEKNLQGIDVLFNTYWVRFNTGAVTHADAARNTRILFKMAKAAGVRKIIHISITNPSAQSPIEYFRRKAELEEALVSLGIRYSILRPALLFGKEDVLINNIAWSVRHAPVFGLFGEGSYRVQPIYVGDLASIAVEQAGMNENFLTNAIGPETFTYRQFIETIRDAIGEKTRVVAMPTNVAYLATRLIGHFMHDVVITKDEMTAMMRGMLHVGSPPVGKTRFSDWIRQNAETIGTKYVSDLQRRQSELPAAG